MLALESGQAADDAADDPRYDPMDQEPLVPSLPAGCKKMLPMLWTAKSATVLKKWPILRLLWKAAPRKCHSKDVEAMVRTISESSKAMAAAIQAIHKASLLGNYPHARKRPPLPLRFSIYRKGVQDLTTEASSKHPFFLYSLKECLVSAVADDFGLRHELSSKTEWHDFESRVIECCDRMIRPYSSIAPVVSARMLLSQGKGAILSANAVPAQTKQLQAYSKTTTGTKPQSVVEAPTIRAVTHDEWQQAVDEGDAAVDKLVATRVAPQVVPYHSWPLALHHRKAQQKAVHPPVPEAAVHTCPTCRSGYFVGHSVGGKKCEALGWLFFCIGHPQSISLIFLVAKQATCFQKSGIVPCARTTPYYSPSLLLDKWFSVAPAATRPARGARFQPASSNPVSSVRRAPRPTGCSRKGSTPKSTGAGSTAAARVAPVRSWPFRLAGLKREKHGKRSGRVRHILFLAI